MTIRRQTLTAALAASIALAAAGPAHADPLTDFIDAVTKKLGSDKQETPVGTPRQMPQVPQRTAPPTVSDAAAALAPDAPPRPQSKPEKPGRQQGRQQPPGPPAPAATDAKAPAPALVAAPLPGEPDPETAPAPSANKGGIPLGGPKPAAVAANAPAPAAPAAAAQQPPAASPDPLPTTKAEVIERINAHFNRMDQMRARFVQVGGYGQRLTGTLGLKRPAHFQFTYDDPHTLEIVSDGRSVAIQDRKKGASDVYSIGLTPLKFLAKEPFDISRDAKIRNVKATPEGIVSVNFDDSSNFGGTSNIEVQYDALGDRLTKLVVVDDKKLRTTITFSDVEVWQRQGPKAR